MSKDNVQPPKDENEKKEEEAMLNKDDKYGDIEEAFCMSCVMWMHSANIHLNTPKQNQSKC